MEERKEIEEDPGRPKDVAEEEPEEVEEERVEIDLTEEGRTATQLDPELSLK